MKCQSKNSDDDQSYEQEDGGRCELCTFLNITEDEVKIMHARYTLTIHFKIKRGRASLTEFNI